jgi:hypothetical protein
VPFREVQTLWMEQVANFTRAVRGRGSRKETSYFTVSLFSKQQHLFSFSWESYGRLRSFASACTSIEA